jgi:hypothetical protein
MGISQNSLKKYSIMSILKDNAQNISHSARLLCLSLTFAFPPLAATIQN